MAPFVHSVGSEAEIIELLGDDAVLIEVRVPDDTLEGDAWYETFVLDRDQIEEFVEDAGRPCALSRVPTTFTQRWNGDYSNDGRGGWVRQANRFDPSGNSDTMIKMTPGKNSTRYGEGM